MRMNYNCRAIGSYNPDSTLFRCRYSLVFVPFTGVDNHRKSVTFAAGLIAKEDVESYIWLLDNFKKAMEHEPTYVVTDQDPSVKIVVARVFTSAHHRFCMWHIMSKVGDKVRSVLPNDETFRCAFDAIVWDETCTIEEFERLWHSVLLDFGLSEHKWLSTMFELREFWIPAYFCDTLIGGLLKTTSRSESQNSVFGKCISQHSGLVEFFIRFEGVIDTQRFKKARLDASCEGQFPQLKTPLQIERQAAAKYTNTVFYDVQSEIYVGCFACIRLSYTDDDGVKHVMVEDSDGRSYTIELNTSDYSVDYSCEMFQRVGMLCGHVFLVYKDIRLESIPAWYTLSRWMRDAQKRPMNDIEGLQLDEGAVGDRGNTAIRQLLNDFYNYIEIASGNTARIEQLAGIVKEHKLALLNGDPSTERLAGKDGVIEGFCGALTSPTISVHPLAVCNNKGSRKRLKLAKEIAVEKANKPKRMCRTCRQMGHQDSRNFPMA